MVVLRPDDSPRALTDAFEVLALASSTGGHSLESVKSGLRSAATATGRGLARVDAEADEAAANIGVEIARRREALGDRYPFDFDGTVLRPQEWEKHLAYVLMLLLSAVPPAAGALARGREYFEVLVAYALQRYLDGDSFRYGWPRRSPVSVDPEKALDQLCEALGEKRSRDRRVVPGKDKDMGVDVVVWKHFPDRRRGKVVIFGQCATGANWRDKLGDPDLTWWRNYIAYNVPPIRLMAVPWTISKDEWTDLEVHGLMLLDRVRACAWSPSWPAPDEIVNWCAARIRDQAA